MDFDAFEKTIAAAVGEARSLEEIETALRSQQRVVSVRLGDYLLKSYPPQREFIVEYRLDDDSTSRKIVNVFDEGNGRFRFNGVRDEGSGRELTS